MIRSLIITFALALPLAALSADPAAAQNAMPALRAKVTVTSEVVRIGDLIENCGPVAEVPIFRSPDLGTRGTVPTEQIVEAIRPHQLIGIDTRGIAEVVVTRASRAISPQEIAARVAKALGGQYGLGDARNISVEFDGDVHTLNVEPNVTGDLQVVSLSYNRRTARFDINFDLPASAALRWQSMRYSGTAFETVDAVSVEHPVEHGEVLKVSDLVAVKRPKSDGTLITNLHAAAGMAARHQLLPGQPLHDADLMKPAIVARNDTVTIVYEAPGLTLTLRGQAQESGALGDTVTVQNVQTKRMVQGVVTAPGRVTVTAAPARVVDADPAPAANPASPPSDQPQREHSVE
jgi:flagellar basal body P-ring formation protein FlgA